MAKKKPEGTEGTGDKKLIAEAVKRYKKCVEVDSDNRRAYRDDMLFTYKPGEQWLQEDKNDRGNDRPMYEFNETRVKVMSVVNHIRANRPQAKIRGVEEGDKELAEVRQGLYLNITNNSDFDSIKDYAAGHQVGGGMGAWRVDTEYSDDTAWDQDIVIKPFIDPMAVHADYAAKDELKRDAKFWFVVSKMTKEAFEAKYPDAKGGFEVDDESDDLNDEDGVWVAEYWRKEPVKKTICLLSDGSSVEKQDGQTYAEGVTVVRERAVNSHKIVQYIISSSEVLEGPNEWAGKEFPFVPVYGFYVILNGKIQWGGLTRYAKDAQRAHNWALTSVFESIANSPQSKWWATPEQAKGNTGQWAEAIKKNFPAMLYNADPMAPGPPERMGGADVPVALIQAAGMSSDALKNCLGIFDASLGQVSNETSGRAIRARQEQGMVATFNFGDNLAKSERRTCEIINDLIPKIYDTERSIRILGQDGSEKFTKLNQRDPVTGQIINDMSKGKFDFVVTTGPSFQTQRQEAAEFYTNFSQTNPALAAAAGDLIVKAQDYPMSDAIAERLRLMLPPPILQALSKDKPLPPEAQAALQQAEQAMAMVQEQGQIVQQAAQEAQTEKAAADKAKSDVQIAVANLKVQEAQLATDVANFKTLVAQTEAKMAQQQQTTEGENERESLTAQLQQALGQIQQEAGQMLVQMAQTMAQIQQSAPPPQVIVPPRPRVTHLMRANGGFKPIYEDEIQQPAAPAGVQ